MPTPSLFLIFLDESPTEFKTAGNSLQIGLLEQEGPEQLLFN